MRSLKPPDGRLGGCWRSGLSGEKMRLTGQFAETVQAVFLAGKGDVVVDFLHVVAIVEHA